MKKFLEEFKAFALKGNMMDMAIGVLIGGAFSTLVTSLTDNIINPIIGILFQTDFSDVVLHLPFDINLGIGAFISAVINFIILAFVLFCMLKAMNKLMDLGKHEEEKPAEPEAPKAPTQEELADRDPGCFERAAGCKRQITHRFARQLLPQLNFIKFGPCKAKQIRFLR